MIRYHRMYRNEIPQKGDLVVVKILSVDDLGAKCELLEYGGIEGMLQATEYTRKRVKSLKKLIQPGNQEVLCVIQVDEDKFYIDLSKKQVTADEIEMANNRYYRNSFVNSIMRYLSNSTSLANNNVPQLTCLPNMDEPQSEPSNTNVEIDDLYEKMCWLMDDDYGDSYNALEQTAKNSMILDKYNIGSNTKVLLIKILSTRFVDQPKTVSCVVEVSCLGEGGVTVIKNAFKESLLDDTIMITVVKCPQYAISIKTPAIDVESAREKIVKVCESIKNKIESYPDGKFSIAKEIEIV